MLGKFRRATHKAGIKYASIRAMEQLMVRAPITSTIYWRIAPRYYSWKFSKRFDEYKAPISPCQRLWVNPKKITHSTGRDVQKGVGRKKNIIRVSSGNWDSNTKRFSDRRIVEAFEQRFVHETEWEETDFFDDQVKRIKERGNAWHGCTDVEELKQRCRQMDAIYEDIRKNGFKTQTELRSKQQLSGFLDELVNEITVDIGREGQILHVGGKHRLTISKILELEKIPVFCDHRHEGWMRKRDEMFRENASVSHPDIPEPTSNQI